MKKEKLFYLYVVLGFILNIFIFPIGGLNFLKSALTALTDLDNNVEVKKVVIESDGYANKSPGSWRMEKSADWTSPTNAKIVFDVNTNPSFHDVPNFDVIMVLDVSGSMSGTKMDKLKESAKKYVNDILNASVDNAISLIEYSSDSSIVTPFVNNVNTLVTDIDELVAGGNTNYYAGLKKVEELLTDYERSQNRGLTVLFMTDGAANEDTSMIESQYVYLKDKYPSMKIIGIQYEMGSKITSYLKQASDVQYDAYMDDIYDHFFEGTYSDFLEYYEKFEIVDYIDTTYFEVLGEDDITVSIGSVKLETNESSQKVIWTIEPDTLITSASMHMKINVRLKKEYQDKLGFYPTNKGVEVTTKLPDEEEKYTESDETPVLRYGHAVYYDGNYPRECGMKYNTEEYHYFHEIVELSTIPPVCEGYKFSGWEVESKVDGFSDNGFIMPNYDVHVKGTWGKTALVKSTEGTVYVAPPPTLYNVMKYKAVPDNIVSAYVTGEDGMDFKSISSETNGKGVYMIADTANSEYPIYYYRGEVEDNNVLFADLCWKMVRTTDTGGVKLIYNGVPTEQGNRKICDNTGEATQVTPKAFNNNYKLAQVGYKYGTIYSSENQALTSNNVLSSDYLSSANYYFSSTISYENGKYILGDDVAKYAWKNNWEKLTGYYTCHSSNDTSCTNPYYIFGADESRGYYLTLSNGKMPDDVNTNVVLGQSIQNNGNDTYTLKDTVTIKRTDWYDNYSKYKNYYACSNDLASDTCSVTNMKYIVSTSNTSFSGLLNKKYGASFTYDNNAKKYTLVDTVETFDPSANSSDLATHHYTCLDYTDTCSSINYIYYLNGTTLHYITINNGKGVEEALAEMFSNKTDSVIKSYIEDTWYASSMVDYEDYLEDTVWCNDRSYEDSKVNSGWNPNGGALNQHLYFDTYYRKNNGTPSLKCGNQDSLTVANGGVNKPVGLITIDEVVYAGGSSSDNNSYYLYTGAYYWTMSPYAFERQLYAYVFVTSSSGGLKTANTLFSEGVRPMISLKPNTFYNDGDGTREKPYVVVIE